MEREVERLRVRGLAGFPVGGLGFGSSQFSLSLLSACFRESLA